MTYMVCVVISYYIVLVISPTRLHTYDIYIYRRSCFFLVDFIYANYARERKFA